MPDEPRPQRAALIAEIDAKELAVRIVEALTESKRPAGASTADAFDAMDPYVQDAARRAAGVAANYLKECLSKAVRPS